MSDKSQKTEKPTQQRLEKARRDGKFPTSRDFVGGLQFVAVVMMLGAWGGQWLHDLGQATAMMLVWGFQPEFGTGDLVRLGLIAARHIFLPLFIAGGLLVVLTLGFQFGVTRFGFTLARLKPDWNRMNPVSRLRELPQQNVAAVVQCAVTLALCCAAFYYIVKRNVEQFYLLPLTSLHSGVQYVLASLLDLLWKSALIFFVLGAIDLMRQRRRFNSEMRMSRQEMREEFKEVEGNPHTKARIRRIQRGMRRRKMMRQVPEATALVVNPTHYAVAIKYDMESRGAPVVTAKGKNYLALRIRELAQHHSVPLVENPPLAQALYKSVPVGGDIPTHLYRAVAEVLAYVYKVMGRTA